MDEFASFYNDVNGDREYDAESFSNWLGRFFTDGVFNGGLAVVASGGMVVTVQSGAAHVGGKTKRFGDTQFTINPANSTWPRIDTIVMERNDQDRDFALKYVQGQYSSSSPSPTAPVREDGVYQLVLAQIYVDAGATGISQSNITDTRTDKTLCGWVVQAVQTIDFEQFTAQFEAYFDEFKDENLAEFEAWFNHMKDQLDTDAAGHLQAEIDAMDELEYTSSDALNPTASESVALLASGETQVSRWEKVSKMFKNIRYLLKMMGNTDISKIGDGTTTGAISSLSTQLMTSRADNIDGNNLLVGYKKGDIRELFFADLPLTVGGAAGVGSQYAPKRTLMFPIMSLGIGTITCRLTTTGGIELLGADGTSLSGTHRLHGHVMYLH